MIAGDLDELDGPYRTPGRLPEEPSGDRAPPRLDEATGAYLDSLASSLGLPPRIVETDSDYRARLAAAVREILSGR